MAAAQGVRVQAPITRTPMRLHHRACVIIILNAICTLITNRISGVYHIDTPTSMSDASRRRRKNNLKSYPCTQLQRHIHARASRTRRARTRERCRRITTDHARAARAPRTAFTSRILHTMLARRLAREAVRSASSCAPSAAIRRGSAAVAVRTYGTHDQEASTSAPARDVAHPALLSDANIDRVARDLRDMPTRKLDGDFASAGRRVAVIPLGTFNADPCVIMTIYRDAGANDAHACGLPSAGVEESTLLESSSVATTSAARRALDALWGIKNRRPSRSDLLGCVSDVADVRGRTVVTPVIAYLGEVKEAMHGRDDVAAISLSTLMSTNGVKPTREGGVEFIGTIGARGLQGHEAMGLHGALRVVAGPNAAYREALYDQFSADYRAAKAVAAAAAKSKPNGIDGKADDYANASA